MRKLLLTLLIALALPLLSLAESAAPAWTETPELIRPGKMVRLSARCAAPSTMFVLTQDGQVPAFIARDEAPQDGEVRVYWDGCGEDGNPVAPGHYTLRVVEGDRFADTPVTIGEEAPVILGFMADDVCSGAWTAWADLSMPGTLTLTLHGPDGDADIFAQACDEGETDIAWDGTINGAPLPEGDWDMTLRLTDETGFSSNPESFTVTVDIPQLATDIEYHTPSDGSPIQCSHDPCYWNMNMGEMDEAAIWDILTQPVTVVKGKQRQMMKLRAQPDKSCEDYVGEVTCDSQAVHILDTQGDWTLIEVYSSSTSGSRVKVWAMRVQGWIETDLLEEREVDQEYGLVIDKLQQRMYLFKDGHLYTTLMISTGFPTKSDPFNETPAGEFLIVSWTGGFWSDKLYCDYALRINSGILIHEVPCFPIFDENNPEKIADKDFANFENYLGEKASHGCIRTQRRKTPEGVNMKWLWDNLNRDRDTKVIIWDELGRTLGYPDDGVILYHNPKGGKSYHSAPTCNEVNEKYWPLTPFTYGQLEDEEFASLRRCKACAPQLRKAEIDVVNEKNHR